MACKNIILVKWKKKRTSCVTEHFKELRKASRENRCFFKV